MTLSSDLDRHPQAAAFLQAIIEQPDDDLPRLAFADWLTEHGDEARAEFIRVQIELARLSVYDPRARPLRDREAALLQTHGDAWRGALARITSEAVFHRGFVERVKLGVRQFMDNAAELVRLAPIRTVQLLRAMQSKLSMADLAASEHLTGVRGLSLSGSQLGDGALAALLGGASWDRLEELNLYGSEIHSSTIRALNKLRLSRLHTLVLAGNDLRRLLKDVLAAVSSSALRRLDLGDCGLDRNDVDALCAWSGLASVESLDLRANRVGVRGTQALTASGRLGALRHLDLNDCAVGIGGMHALADCPALAGLTRLRLTGNAIKPAGIEALAAGPSLRNLEALDLASNELAGDGTWHLAGWPGLAPLRSLGLRNNLLDAARLGVLLASPHLGELVDLELADNYFLKGPGMKVLAGCERLATLDLLDLRNCGLDHQAIEPLLDSLHLGRLHTLLLWGNRLGEKSQARLKARFADCRF
jgi:uncharacterized protein (TIGR02996 family)